MIDLFCALPLALVFTAVCVALGLMLRLLSWLGFSRFERMFNHYTNEAIKEEQERLAHPNTAGVARGRR